MAQIGASAARANSSTSPTTDTPRARASWIRGSARATPGLTTSRSAAAKTSGRKPPTNTARSGISWRRVSSPGGLSRESVTAAITPCARR